MLGLGFRLASALDDQMRAGIGGLIGAGVFFLGWRRHGGWEMPFLSAWNAAAASYLLLLGVVIFAADAEATRTRASKVDRAALSLLIALVTVIVLGTLGVGVILTAVGQRSTDETRILVALSVLAVILSWALLHTAFAQLYARLFYDEAPAPGSWREGFIFPETRHPAYSDFLYLAFTIGLTYATSDVSITQGVNRRAVFGHSVISFFFYSLALGVVLNAVVTS